MLIVFLLLFGILVHASYFLAAAMVVGGVRLLARGLDPTSKHQGWNLVGALLLLPLPMYFYYLLNPDPVDRVVEGFRMARSCRRYTEFDVPDEPVRSRGVELTSNTGANRMADREIEDLALNPLIYLGSKGGIGFDFVEVRGQRYEGTAESYTVTPYTTATAAYRISVSYVHTRPSRFQLTVSERSTHRRIGSITGFQNHLRSCPTYSDTKQMVWTMIRPIDQRLPDAQLLPHLVARKLQPLVPSDPPPGIVTRIDRLPQRVRTRSLVPTFGPTGAGP